MGVSVFVSSKFVKFFWSCLFLSEVNMVVVKVQTKKVTTGPVASSLPVTVRDTERDREREAAASKLVQTHSMVAATVMLLVMSLTLLSLANFRDVGRENLCLRAQIAALQREKAVLECTARKFMHREQLAKAASFRETQISIFINGPVVPEVTVWYRFPMAMLWITAPESAREESQGEIVNKLDAEVYEREMDEEEDEGMEATMEETVEEKVEEMEEMEEIVQEEIGNINKEDKLYI